MTQENKGVINASFNLWLIPGVSTNKITYKLFLRVYVKEDTFLLSYRTSKVRM
jgi:hypothetical protein